MCYGAYWPESKPLDVERAAVYHDVAILVAEIERLRQENIRLRNENASLAERCRYVEEVRRITLT